MVHNENKYMGGDMQLLFTILNISNLSSEASDCSLKETRNFVDCQKNNFSCCCIAVFVELI